MFSLVPLWSPAIMTCLTKHQNPSRFSRFTPRVRTAGWYSTRGSSERHPQGFPHASGTLLGSAGTWPLTVLTPDNALRMKRKKTPERHPTLLTSRNDVDVAYRTAWDEGLDVLEQKSCIQSRYAHACPSVCICEDRTGSSLGGLLQAMSPVGSPGRR